MVVKPVPSSVRHLVTPPADDEMFLDGKEEDILNDVTMDTGKKIKETERKRRKRRRRREEEDFFHRHIIYKRAKTKDEDDFSDYGKFLS